MSPAPDTRRTKDIFLAAHIIRDVEERARFLAQACGEDAELLRRVQTLLDADAVAADFLEVTLSVNAAPGDKVGYFGDYVLLDEIARGANGVVFRARQASLDRVVALKMLRDRPELTNEADVQRLRAEAKAAAALDHPNILPIYEVGAHDGQPYFSMKLITGGTLQFRMAEYQADARKAVALMIKVARAVHHAHAKGILHRDLKPGNILIDSNGEPHIADFGLARKIGIDSGLTLTGQVIGTPHYMSPEQARGGNGELTPGTDIYSLGAVLYELLAGHRIHASKDLIDLLKDVVEKPAPPLPAPVPRPLAAVVMKCLEKSPSARYGTADEFADALQAWLSGTASAPPRPPRKPLPWVKLALAAACVALAFGLHAWWPRPCSVVTTLEDELDPPGTLGSGVSLREAVRDAAPGERITFDRSVFGKAGTITLDATKGEIVMDKNLELDASALPQGLTLCSPQGGHRKLRISPEAAVTVKRVSFTAAALASGIGAGQGGAIENEGTLTLLDCRFIKNGGGGNGGAIFTLGGLTMERCVFEGNETLGIGGALCVKASPDPVRVIHCVFRGNVSHGNGGGAVHVADPGKGKVILEHCTLTDNSATASKERDARKVADRGAGGGIRVERGDLEITHCIIAGNKAVIAGAENIHGAVNQTGPNFIGGNPQDAPAGFGASVK